MPTPTPPLRELRHSVCALDCPDCCSLLVTVENGTGTRLRGHPDHPITRGFLCGKVAQYLEREYSPQRLLHPLKRAGRKGEGRFERIGWDEALDVIASRLKSVAAEFGPEAVLPYSYGGNMGYLNGSGMDRRFFHRFGASRLDRTICASAGAAGMTATLGHRLATEPEQFADSKLILAWGANILATNVHLWPFILEARRKGARFYVIDPLENKTTRLADRHFAINPGSDLSLALGLMHVIFRDGLEDRDYLERYTAGFRELRDMVRAYPPERVERDTGIPADDVEMLAREYATTRPAAIRLNYGIQRSDRGGSAVRAVAMLPAVVGSWRESGGGIQLSTSYVFQIDRHALERPDLQFRSPLGREARLVNMAELGAALNDLNPPPVKALVVYNCNPAAVVPNQSAVLQGLCREDLFTVVLEQFPTDTVDYADIVLPVTTFLENTDLYFAYGHHYLQMARPALPAPGECKSNVEIFRLLAERLGFDDPALHESEDDMIHAVLASGHPYLEGVTLERLDREKWIRLPARSGNGPFLPFIEGGFGGPDGRCDLSPAGLEYTAPVESRHGDAGLKQRYPLELIASKTADGMNSTFGYREAVDQETSQVTLHPDDARPRGIAEGDLVRLFNDRGSVLRTARISGGLRTGTISAPSVRWNKRSAGGAGINTLTSARLTDIGGGPTFYSCLVQVEKCGD